MEASTVCLIQLTSSGCRIAVIQNAEIIDSSLLALGTSFMQIGSDRKLLALSEAGETFLDGVAKLSLLRTGQAVDETLLRLIADLFAEVLMHTVSTSQPPQLVQRLLESDALRLDYQIEKYLLSGISSELSGAGSSMNRQLCFKSYLAKSVIEALEYRSFKYTVVSMDGSFQSTNEL